jgi:hypothetical protein
MQWNNIIGGSIWINLIWIVMHGQPYFENLEIFKTNNCNFKHDFLIRLFNCLFKLGWPMHTCFVHYKDNVHVWSGHLCHHISCLSPSFLHKLQSPTLLHTQWPTFFASQLCFDIPIKLLIDFSTIEFWSNNKLVHRVLQQWFLPMTQTWQFKTLWTSST